MAQEFNQFSTLDQVVNDKGYFTRPWAGDMDTFYQTLIGYLSPYGIFLPQLTVQQRDSIQLLASGIPFQSPVEGQLIYTTNTTVGPPRTASLQVWQVKAGVGAWRTITTTP